MSQSSQDPNWLPWITALVALAGLLYTALKRFFSFVTREEFTRVLNERHAENKEDGRERKATLQRIEDKIDAAQLGVLASRLERTEQDVQELRDWKHQVDPFISRRVDP